ncbi:hypothetical protein ACR6C2_13675 [Streptomyces sp. INA 01156]
MPVSSRSGRFETGGEGLRKPVDAEVADLWRRAPSTVAFTKAHRRSHVAQKPMASTSTAPPPSVPGPKGRTMVRRERGAVSSRKLMAKPLSGKRNMTRRERAKTAR